MVDNFLKKHQRRLTKPRVVLNQMAKVVNGLLLIRRRYAYILTKVLNNNSRTVIFKTSNNLFNMLHNENSTPLEMKTGAYKLSCNDCEWFYIGQRGRAFHKCFVEHSVKHN